MLHGIGHPPTKVTHLPLARFKGQPTPPPWPGSKVNHLPPSQGQRSTNSPWPGSQVNHLRQPGSKVNYSPPPGIHKGTTANGRAVRILLECILVRCKFSLFWSFTQKTCHLDISMRFFTIHYNRALYHILYTD